MIINLMKQELRRDEGVKLKPYYDTKRKLTIGIGRNLDDVGITPDEADYLLTGDIAGSMRDLDMGIPWWRDLSEARQRALLNMCFNMGLGKLMGFHKMLEALRTQDWAKASQEALDSEWAREVGPRAQRIAVIFATG